MQKSIPNERARASAPTPRNGRRTVPAGLFSFLFVLAAMLVTTMSFGCPEAVQAASPAPSWSAGPSQTAAVIAEFPVSPLRSDARTDSLSESAESTESPENGEDLTQSSDGDDAFVDELRIAEDSVSAEPDARRVVTMNPTRDTLVTQFDPEGLEKPPRT